MLVGFNLVASGKRGVFSGRQAGWRCVAHIKIHIDQSGRFLNMFPR